MLRRLLTKNFKEVPLLFVNFNYQAFKKNGEFGSCMIHFHPILKNDEKLKLMVEDIVDYIRDNYDMKKMP